MGRKLSKSRPTKRRTRAEVDRIRQAICDVLAADNPMTVRQVFYRLVVQAVIAKTENEYKSTVGRLLVTIVHIDPAIERRLCELAPGAEIHFERVAVRPEQVAAWGLPTRPTKKTDSRSKAFRGESVEVDAIPPARLRELVRGCIQRHVDRRALEVLRAAERSEREVFGRLCRRLAAGRL
jgi:hypothetical protein